MKYESNKLLGFDDDYHRHCDMCERPVKEWYVCGRCYHAECRSCRTAYHDMNKPLTHPCDWLVMKRDCFDGKYVKDK